MIPLIKKELRLYFSSSLFYVVAMVFLLVTDYLFFGQINYYSALAAQAMQFQQSGIQLNLHTVVFRPAMMNMGVVLLLITPLLTMRLIAEEKKTRTIELLLTSPITITAIVLAKFLSAFLVYLLLLALTLHIPILLAMITAVSVKPLLSAYLGMVLVGGSFIALGLFASSMTENQIIAAVVSFGMLIGLWMIGISAQDAGETPMGHFFNFLSLVDHLDNLLKGLIATSDIGYFISLITLGLFLSHRVVESTRWK